MNKTFKANIYSGLRCGYSKKVYSYKYAEKICQEYVNNTKWCVSITKTKYIYVNGSENGIIIGIIYYKRFPMDSKTLKNRTLALAKLLMDKLQQTRVTILFNNDNIMLTANGKNTPNNTNNN